MKKITFVAIFTMMGYFLFPQSDVMSFFSMGFNAQDKRGRITYFFYGYEDYSEAFFGGDFSSLSLIDEITPKFSSFYPRGRIEWNLPSFSFHPEIFPNNTILYDWFFREIWQWTSEFHRYENGKLVYWGRTYFDSESDRGGIDGGTTRIEHNAENLLIYEDGIQIRYYNISRDELLDMFLKNYVGLICEINDVINGNIDSNDFDAIMQQVLRTRTQRELSIFRNCLYAIKGYRFSSSTWIDFFNKHLPNYNARYSNAEVTAMFTNNENRLLDLIIQYENRR